MLDLVFSNFIMKKLILLYFWTSIFECFFLHQEEVAAFTLLYCSLYLLYEYYVANLDKITSSVIFFDEI
jgi:hypothetical protein